MPDPFESPRMLVAGAKEDLIEVQQLGQAFFAAGLPAPQFAADGGPGEYVAFLTPPQPPDRLRRRAANALNDLRHALDQITYSASKELGSPRLDKTYFPACEDANDFDNNLFGPRGRCKDIHPDIRPFLRALTPWWAQGRDQPGNSLLKGLCTITGPNKHRVVLKPAFIATGLQMDYMGGGTFVLPLVWDEPRGRLEIARTSTPDIFQFRGRIPLSLSFGNIRGFAGIPLETALAEAIRVVESILLGVEAETSRILASRTS